MVQMAYLKSCILGVKPQIGRVFTPVRTVFLPEIHISLSVTTSGGITLAVIRGW